MVVRQINILSWLAIPSPSSTTSIRSSSSPSFSYYLLGPHVHEVVVLVMVVMVEAEGLDTIPAVMGDGGGGASLLSTGGNR